MSDDDAQVTLPDDDADESAEPAGEESGSEPDAPAEPAVPVCSECGEPVEPDQQYCLECGAPTPAAPALRRRIGPAGVLALGLLALAIGAGALAYAIASEDDSRDAQATGTVSTIPTALPTVTFPDTFTFGPTSSVDVTDTLTQTGPLPTVTDPFATTTGPGFPGTTTFTPTVPTFPGTTTFVPTFPGTTATVPPTLTTAPPPVTRTTPTTPTTPGSGSDDWTGGDAWTVILASTRSRSDATAFRDRIRAGGRSAGLIQSSNYSSLEPGYWVVFTGVYTSRSTAISQAAGLRSRYPGAYAQRVEE